MGQNFSEEEKAAMRDTVAERQRSKKADAAADETKACADKIAEMSDADRPLAEQLHGIITSAAPELAVSTWYGMPAYKLDGKVVVFFKPGEKFKSRYCTLGFEDAAAVDEGTFWPTSYAVTKIGAAEEKTITALVKKAVKR